MISCARLEPEGLTKEFSCFYGLGLFSFFWVCFGMFGAVQATNWGQYESELGSFCPAPGAWAGCSAKSLQPDTAVRMMRGL